MTHAPFLALAALTALVALLGASAAAAPTQLQNRSQGTISFEQARARARLPAGSQRDRNLQRNTAAAPAPSIFQAVPAQLSTARRPIAGQRQTAASLVPANGPLERVNERIGTRVQSRIVSRLDRYGANPPVPSPFSTAAERTRVGPTRPR